MKRATAWGLGAVALVVLAACATSPLGRRQLTFMPDGQMNTMGAQAFDEMKSKTPRETNSRINAYVQCISDAVTRQAASWIEVPKWEVVVFRDPSANAFALPGGKIGVHTGILPVAKTQDQLAAIMGHEVGHVIARHGNERVSQALAVQSGLLIGQAVAGKDEKGQVILAALGLGAQFGILMPYGRQQESESDLIGLELMAKAGFDPRQSVELWRNMAAASGGQPPEFLSTHPSHETRIQGLQGAMNAALGHFQAARAAGRNPACGTL